MTVAEYFESLSVESLMLLIGFIGLMAIVIGLHVRNLRWVREMSSAQASAEARSRIDTLLTKVEKLADNKPKMAVTRSRPLNKGRKFVPAARTIQKPVPQRRAR